MISSNLRTVHDTFARKSGTFSKGDIFEIYLLILTNLRLIKMGYPFYLASNMEEGGLFDDMCFKYWNKNETTVVLLQAKHKENVYINQLTVEKLMTDRQWALNRYFKSYLDLRSMFESEHNPIFQHNPKRDVYVLCTNCGVDGTLRNRLFECDDAILLAGERAGAFKFKLTDQNRDIIAYLAQSNNHNLAEEFLRKFVLVISEANADVFPRYIQREMEEYFKLTAAETKNMFRAIKEKFEEWLGKRGQCPFFTQDDKLFDKIIRRGFYFDVIDPIDTFIGRDEILLKLDEVLKVNHPGNVLTCICGLGGVGKTQLVRKYIQQNNSFYDENVIWINCESDDSIKASFLRLAQDKLNIVTKNSCKHLKSIVEDIYEFFSNRKCLFVFDNVVINIRSMDEYLPTLPPQSSRPYILITSRNQIWGSGEVILLNELKSKESEDLINSQMTDDKSMILAETLDNFPLAIQQAIVYIKENDNAIKSVYVNKKYEIASYLKEYETDIKRLLDFPLPDYINSWYKYTTFNTWNRSFEAITSSGYGSEVMQFLNMLSYFPVRTKIPSEIFSKMTSSPESLGRIVEIAAKQYSMITVEKNLLSINKVVQDVRKEVLYQNQEEENILTSTRDLLTSNESDLFSPFTNQILTYINEFKRVEI